MEAGRLPLARGLAPTRRELLVREIVLGLKRGRLDTVRLRRKYGLDPRVEWRAVFDRLAAEGAVESLGETVVLSRPGLLRVDALLPAFFER